MSYPRIYQRLYCAPVAITADRFRALHSAFFPRLQGGDALELAVFEANAAGRPAIRSERNAVGPRGKRQNRIIPDASGTLFSTANGRPEIAVVPAYGILAKGLSAFEEDCGEGTDIDPIGRAFQQAVEARGIEAIVIDIASPGGEVVGIDEQAEAIMRARTIKPVYAWSDSDCCSAAMWAFGCAASEFYAAPSAQIGSIGVRAGWLDETIAMELAGLELHVFESGDHKGAGLPFRGMTEEEKGMLQSRVDFYGEQFRARVVAGRGPVSADTMQGQWFIAGAEGEARNLIDGTFDSWGDFIDAIPA